MPLNDYKCDCGFRCEAIVGFTDPPPNCPKCNKAMVKEWNRPPVTHFRGSGFYATDYGNQRHNALGELPSDIDDPDFMDRGYDDNDPERDLALMREFDKKHGIDDMDTDQDDLYDGYYPEEE